MHLKPRDLCLAIFVVIIWGANAAIGKLAVPQIPVFAFLTARFAITGLLCLPFVEWKKAYILSSLKIALLLNVLHYGLTFSAMQYLDASALALLQQTQVPAAILLGWVFFKEPISFKLGIGIALGFAGLLVLKTIDTITVFTVFIKKENIANFSYKPEDVLKGKKICVKGKVIDLGGTTTMYVESEREVKIE